MEIASMSHNAAARVFKLSAARSRLMAPCAKTLAKVRGICQSLPSQVHSAAFHQPARCQGKSMALRLAPPRAFS